MNIFGTSFFFGEGVGSRGGRILLQDFFFLCKTNSSSVVKLKILKIAVFLRWENLYRRTSSVPVFKGVGGIDEELLVKLSSLIT